MQHIAGGLGLLLATLAGACLGWLMATQLSAPGPDPGLVAPALAARAAPQAPVLEGVARAPSSRKSTASGPRPLPRPVIPVALAEEITPVFTLAGKPLPEGRGKDVLRALTMLYAALGRVSEYERFFAQGIEAGLESADLLGFLELLPLEARLASLDRLLAGPLALVEVPPVLLATLLAGAGAKERAIKLLVDALEAALPEDVVLKLVDLDPKGAAARLLAHPGMGEAGTDLLGNIGAALVKAGHSDLAWPFLDRISSRGEFPDNVLEQLAGVDPAMGMRIVERMLAARREDPRAWNWMGKLREGTGDLGGAFEAYREAATRAVSQQSLEGMLRADSQRAYMVAKTLDLSGFTGEDRSVLAVLALHHGAFDEAYDTLARGLSEAPSEYTLLNAIVRADPQRAAALLAASVASYAGDDKDEVLGAYAHALRLGGRSAEAREAYLEALALDGSDSEWIFGLARVDASRALEALEASRSGNDDEDWWQRCQAECLMRTGRRAEAMVIYNRWSDAGAAGSLGLFDPAEGRRRLEAAIAKEPTNASHWVTLGEMERELGNLSGARSAFEQAVRLEPTSLWHVVRWRQLRDPPPVPANPAMR